MKLLTILSLLSINANATNYYFSNSGNNSNSGTSTGSPYLDIGKLNTLSLSSGDSIKFNGGNTFVGTITQTTAGIVYTSYGTGKATLTGLISLTSWSNLGSNIWSASLNSGAYLDVLLRNGNFVAMGRSPDVGSYWNVDSRVQITGGDGNTGYTGQTLTSSSLTTNFVGGRAYIRKNAFNYDNDIITSYSGTTIGYATCNGNPISDNNNKFFVQNHLATLTTQYEWYYDPVAHVVKMYSTTDPSSFGIKAAQYDFALRINNQSGTNTSGVTVKNLILEGYDSVAICLTGVNNPVIENCEIYHTGENGISVTASVVGGTYSRSYGDYLCNNLIAYGNIIRWSGNAGIFSSYTSNKVKLLYNIIDSSGVYEGKGAPNNKQHVGIMVEYPGGNGGTVNNDSVIIFGNRVTYSGYSGIIYQGKIVYVEKNYVDYFGLMLSDAGGIYTSRDNADSSSGPYKRTIDHNIVMNGIGQNNTMFYGGTGGMPTLYQDDISVNITITNNTLIEGTRYGDYFHNNRNITFQYNNVFNTHEDAAIGVEHDNIAPGWDPRGLDIQYNNIYMNSIRLVHLQNNLTSGDIANFGTINNNYYSNSSATNAWYANDAGTGHDYSTLAAWTAAYGYDAASHYQTVSNDSMRIFYNDSFDTISAVFGGMTYRDLQGNNYTNSLTLPPFESKIVKRVTFIAPISPTTNTYIFNRSKVRVNYIKQ